MYLDTPEFLDSGRKCLTLDSARWTLHAGLWMLDSVRFSMFHQIFLSPQVKRCAIITYKHGIYELAHELPNNVRLRILGS